MLILNMFSEQTLGNELLRTRRTVLQVLMRVKSPVNHESLGPCEVESTDLTSKPGRWDTEVVNVRPFLLETKGTFHTLRSMFPEEMGHEVGLGTVGHGTLPTEVIQLVFLHMVLQILLIRYCLEAQLTLEMVSSEMDHVVEESG